MYARIIGLSSPWVWTFQILYVWQGVGEERALSESKFAIVFYLYQTFAP